MRLKAALALLAGALVVALLWRLGAFAALAAEAAALQRAMQSALAQSVRALRAGEPWALASLMGAAAAYGVAHAVGPGHGKVLIGAAAAGTRASAARLSAIALAGSLAQGAVAVALIYGALALAQGVGAGWIARSDQALAPVGHGLLAALGLWIGWRGFRALRQRDRAAGCGHVHGPDPARAADADWRTALALIGAVAARPCGGAMLTLAVAWGAGVPVAGALAVLAMSLGVAAVTVATALAAVGVRDAALFASAPRMARAAGALQAGVGALALTVGLAGLAATL